MATKFDNEVFEDNDGSEAGSLEDASFHGKEHETIVFDKETGEVLGEAAKPSVRLVNGHQVARSASSGAKGTHSDFRQEKSPKTRVKRTEAEMISSLGGSALKEATYVAERISKLEDKISELMGAVGQKAREHILNDFPHLSRY